MTDTEETQAKWWPALDAAKRGVPCCFGHCSSLIPIHRVLVRQITYADPILENVSSEEALQMALGTIRPIRRDARLTN
jgi:hypothetical protein